MIKKWFGISVLTLIMSSSYFLCEQIQAVAADTANVNEVEEKSGLHRELSTVFSEELPVNNLLIKSESDNNKIVTMNVEGVNEAESFSVNGFTYEVLSDTTVKIADGTTASGAVTIPAEVSNNGKTYTVTIIGYKAFSGGKGITSVIMPDTITEIETGGYDSTYTTDEGYLGAFSNCESLFTIKLSSNLEKIGRFSFVNCSLLQNVSLPSKIESIEEGAFGNCSSITTLILPSSIKNVGQSAFSGTSLVDLTIPKGCSEFHNWALGNISTLQAIYVEAGNPNYCSDDGVLYWGDYSWLLKYPPARNGSSYTIKSSTDTVSSFAFSHTANLTTLIISSGLTRIGGGASLNSSIREFKVTSDCKNFIEKDGILYSKDGKTLLSYPASKADKIFFIPSGVTTVATGQDYIWNGNKYLEELYIPASVTKFDAVMWESNNLKKVIFAKNSNLAYIPGWCFKKCTSLESICIPDSVTSLAQDYYGNTFYYCENLKSIYIGKDSKLYGTSDYGIQSLCGCPNLTVYAYGQENNISRYVSSFAGVKYTDLATYTSTILGMTFDDTYVDLCLGQDYQLNTTVYPAKELAMSYATSNDSIATVSETGLVHVSGTGTCYITCEAQDGSGEYTRCFISAKKTIQDLSVNLSKYSFEYDGTEKKPVVTIQGLTEGTDFTVSYSNNKNVGTATIKITGTGNYTGTITKTFRIIAKSIAGLTTEVKTKNYTYDGKAKTPEVTLKNGSITLKKGTDYTITYSSNKNIGTAKVVITGTGNYTGTITKTFRIIAKSITGLTTEVKTKSYTYDGKAKTPEVTLKNGSITLKKGTDYTITYSSNKNIGTAKVVIKGTGNYTGTITKTFTIKLAKVKAKVKSTKRSVTISWGKVNGVTGYVVYMSTSKKGTYKKIATVTAIKRSYKKTKLKYKKTYYFKVRAYKTVAGKKVYGEYSKEIKARIR